MQAAFGGNKDEINALTNYEDYLNQQFSEPPTYLYDKVKGDESVNVSFVNKDFTNLWETT